MRNVCLCWLSLAFLLIPFGLRSQNPMKVQGAAGYNHPNQYLTKNAVKVADNMEPVIQNPEQDAAVKRKLDELHRKTGKRPNIIIFLVDDCGWLDYGFNGGGISVGNNTPHLDSVAANGLILTSAYSQPSCSPTRATIMTGQYPVHHGILVPPMYGMPGGLEGLTTVAQLLSKQGYTTQAIGKWHMGENKGSQPQNVGFDDFRGFLSVSDMYTEWRDPAFNPEVALSPDRKKFIQDMPFNKSDVHAVKGGEVENIKEITVENIQNLDQDWCKYGEDFLRKQANSNKPFFLYYGTRAAHFDNYPNDYYLGRSAARTTYSDAIVEIDDIFNRLFNVLQATGQLDNTLILFTSDNGPEAEVPPNGRTIFRGGKGSTWEGGVRVPTFVYWKGMINPRKSEGLFDLSDILPTALSLAGKPGAELSKLIPAKTYIDGIDQASFLVGDNSVSNRKSVFYFWDDKLAAVRVDEFKYAELVQNTNEITQRGYNGGFSGGLVQAYGSFIFNLYTNPQEDETVGIRHIPLGVPIQTEFNRYKLGVLKKYPPHVQVSIH